MNGSWKKDWRGIRFAVENRAARLDGGATLRVGALESAGSGQAEPAEWLRFDCFEQEPHWHLDPNGQDQKRPLDERGDIIAETLALLETDLPRLLEEADAPAAVSKAARDGRSESPEAWRAHLEALSLAMRHRLSRHGELNLDDLDLRVLQQRRSEKWHTYPKDILPAWVAEMDFPVAAPIQTELRRFAAQADVGYPLGLRETGLPDLFCERMASRFDWHPEPARVEILSEVVQGMYLALEAFSEPGDGVVVQTPIYPPFLSSVREMNRRLVENRFVLSDGQLAFDPDALTASIDANTRMLLFCNPHNPSGHVFTRPELERIAALAIEHDLVVVSDEIHNDLLFDGRRHIPFASLSPEIAARTITLTSASKTFNIPGLRCAIAHFGSEALQNRFNTVVHRYIRGGIGLFGLYATMAAWNWGQPWLDEVLPYLQANRDFAEKALHERVPEIKFIRPEATYLAWLDFSALGLDSRPASYLRQHGRVALSDGRSFGPGWDAFARLNFATSRSILTEIIDRIGQGLGR
ncbi:MAG: MalY/PatB family protein [Myxococcota bacterium]